MKGYATFLSISTTFVINSMVDTNNICDYGERYFYDARGRVKKQINYFDAFFDTTSINGHYEVQINGEQHEIIYNYDLSDKLIYLEYKEDTIYYTYDDFGRLENMGIPGNDDYYASLSYTDRNELERMKLGTDMSDSGLQTIDYHYNDRGWLTLINDSSSSATVVGDLFGQKIYYHNDPYANPLGSAQYNGNLWGQKISIQDTSFTKHYNYDEMDRVIGIAKDSATDYEGFTYDGNGNIWQRGTHYRGIIHYEYSDSNRNLIKLTWDIHDSTSEYHHDNNGNMIKDSSALRILNMFYDGYNRLNEIVVNPAADTFNYNIWMGYSVNNERIYKFTIQNCSTIECPDSMPGDTIWDPWPYGMEGMAGGPPEDTCLHCDTSITYYVRAKPIGGKVIAEWRKDDELASRPEYRYFYAGQNRIAMKDKPDSLYFYLNDHLGSSRVLIDSLGNIRSKYYYYTFGEDDNSVEDKSQPMVYTGKPFDNDHGINLYYYGARYYNPLLGRFISADPLASKYPSWSPYTYTMNNPIRYYDPNGMWTATYDDDENEITVTAEDGDNLQGLYEQMGMSEEEFAKAYNIDDMSSFQVKAGKTSFDITSHVISNTNFVGSAANSNCHGFVAQATGVTTQEGSLSQMNTTNMTQTSSPTTGDVAIYNMQGTFQYTFMDQPVNASNIQGHSAIFIVNNQAGQAQYLNRINTGQPVSVSTQSQIVDFFANPNNAKGGASAYKILPKLNPNPVFFSR